MIESYSLDLDVDFEAAIISGNVSLRSIDTEDPFDLDAKEMQIKNVTVDENVVPFVYDKKRDLIRISGLPKKRDITFNVQYEKQISDKASTGVYKCHFGSEYFIVTDFEPDRARTFFPCKDDPAWKAVFNVSVTTRKDLKVISNTTIRRIDDLDGGKRRFVFNSTPRMSTYLLFVGIGNFVEKSTMALDKKVIVAARPEMFDKLDFTLEIASDILKESEQYFGVPYPLDKLHVIALSEYSGAMENWGAITASEIVAIIDKSSTTYDKRAGAIVTAHEIQHQWFGDLVTMKWWNDIWLNEGFATFMSYKMVDSLYSEWDSWGEFLLRFGFESMNVDKLHTTHPVEVKMKTAAEMNEVFDFISYGKGASVLRMIEAFLGEEPFRRGISSYIKNHSYSNATSEDLWKSLEESSGQPISSMMQAWIRKPGFPLVSVENRGRKIIFHQRRFHVSEGEKQLNTEVWPIPIIAQVNGETQSFLFTEEKHEIDVPDGSLSQLKVNFGQTGFYCVGYDESIYFLLEKEFSSLSDLDKAGIMNDLLQLLMAKIVDADLYFRFVSLCSKEDDYTTIRTVCRELDLLCGIADQSSLVREKSITFLKSQLERLGTSEKQGENPGDSVLRELVTFELARLDLDFARKMGEKFAQYDSLSPEIRGAVSIGYARISGSKAYDVLTDMVKHSKTEGEREKLYMGLVCLEDPTFVEKAIDFSASGEVSRTDIYWTLYYCSRNPQTRKVAWEWVKKNFDKLWNLLGSTLFVLNLLESIVPRAAVEDEEEAKAFFSDNRLQKWGQSVKRDLEMLHLYSELRKGFSS